MQFDPVALVNSAPSTALCILVYFELRAQRGFMKGLSDTLTSLQTSLDLLAQLVSVKIKSRPPTPVPIERKEDDGK